jgi:hypothetical protein
MERLKNKSIEMLTKERESDSNNCQFAAEDLSLMTSPSCADSCRCAHVMRLQWLERPTCCGDALLSSPLATAIRDFLNLGEHVCPSQNDVLNAME